MPEKLILALPDDPVLKKIAAPVEDVHAPEFQAFVEALKAACVEYDGVGIAAPQVGKSLQLFIIRPGIIDENDRDSAPLEAVINPKIASYSDEAQEDYEGCLSIPGMRGLVFRAEEIKVKYISSKGTRVKKLLKGYAARVFQHEFDHLQGILYPMRMEKDRELITLEEYEKLEEE